jgi:predicted nucleic acid-binding protein
MGVKLWGDLSAGDLVVVDSAPLIYVLDDTPKLAPLFQGLFEAAEKDELRIAISAITLAEVLVGPLKQGRDALAKRYEKALGRFDIVPVTPDISVTAARLRASTGLRLPDALQAATVLEIEAVALVTHDRDFSRLKGLRVLSPRA